MSDIDDLCQIIHRGIGLNFEDLGEEIIAAGFHRDRTITAVEELDALADRSVVRSRYHNTFVCVGEYVEGEPCWCGMDGGDYASSDISLPATVLWEPGDDDE